MVGFWWTNRKGKERWANIKYERIPDFSFWSGKMGHTLSTCKEEVVLSEEKQRFPLYGPWLAGTKPKGGKFSSKVVSQSKPLMVNNNEGRTWKEIMKHAEESRAPNPANNDNWNQLRSTPSTHNQTVPHEAPTPTSTNIQPKNPI